MKPASYANFSLTRLLTGLVGMLIGASVDLIVNLLASVIEGQAGQDLLGRWVWLLVALVVGGLIAGLWLGGPAQALAPANAPGTNGDVSVTRLRALWSKVKTRGTGVRVDKVFVFKSNVDIDTRHGDADD